MKYKTHPLTTRGNLVCRLRKEVLLAREGITSHHQHEQHEHKHQRQQGEEEGGHDGQAFQSRQMSDAILPITHVSLTHTALVPYCHVL